MKYKREGEGNRADILVSAGQPGIEPRQLSCFRVGSSGKGTTKRVLLIRSAACDDTAVQKQPKCKFGDHKLLKHCQRYNWPRKGLSAPAQIICLQ